MQRRTLTAALVLTALAAFGASSSVSLASSANSADPTPGLAGLAVAPETIPYTLSYTDEVFGPVKCTGRHVINKANPGTETSGGKDVFSCNSTSGKRLTNVTPGQVLDPWPASGWNSDYFALKGLAVAAISITGKVGPQGRGYKAVAIY